MFELYTIVSKPEDCLTAFIPFLPIVQWEQERAYLFFPISSYYGVLISLSYHDLVSRPSIVI